MNIGPIVSGLECRQLDSGLELRGTVLEYGDVAVLGSGLEEVWEPGSVVLAERLLLGIGHPAVETPIARRGHGLTLEDGPDRLALRATVPAALAARHSLAESVNAALYQGLSVEYRPITAPMMGSRRTVRRAAVAAIAVVADPAFPASRLRQQGQEHGNPLRRWADYL